MEYPIVSTFDNAMLRDKPKRQDQRPGPLKQYCSDDDLFCQPDHAADLQGIHALQMCIRDSMATSLLKK